MEKQLRCSLMLTLEEMALRRLAAVLWCESDVLTLTANYKELPDLLKDEYETWENTVVDVVEDKMSKLQLPDSITEQMTPIIEFIGSHILNWKLFHKSILRESGSGLNVHILEKLCFTTAGSVDYRQTAEALVRSDALDIVSRYKLSCLYCLEDYIPDLWSDLPGEKKMYFHDEKAIISSVDTFLWFLWPYILKGEEYKLDCVSRSSGNQSNFRQFAFEYSASRGNRAAVEYFLRKLSPEERENSLIRAAKNAVENVDVDRYIYDDDDEYDDYPKIFPREKFSDVLCHLLSVMSEEQQMQVFKERPDEFLRFFLRWPWQDIFLDNVDVVWNHFPESDFDTFFWKTIYIIDGSNFPHLRRDFSLRMTISFRKYFINQEYKAEKYFFLFLRNQDAENIKFILRSIDAADKVELLSSFSFFTFYSYSNLEGRCHIVETSLRDAMLSEEEKGRIKKAFMEYLRMAKRIKIEREYQNLRRFFVFLYGKDVTAQNKRSSDNETLDEVKNSSVKRKKTE